MDRLASMEAFVKAVDLGSFAAAADALEISPPMVGKHVRFLEQRLGATLINRTTRRQSLTEFGSAYYDRCRIVLAEVEAADALTQDYLAEPRGRLRVTMPVHLGRHCVAPLLMQLTQVHQGLDLDLSFDDGLTDLAEGRFDLAIRTGDLPDMAMVTGRKIASQTMVTCASREFISVHGRPNCHRDLPDFPLIAYRRNGPVAAWYFPEEGGRIVDFVPTARFRFDDLDAIADAAVLGLGIAWVPRWLVRDRLASGALVDLLPHEKPTLYDCYAIWPKSRHLPLKVRAAVDLLAASLSGRLA